MKRAAAVLAAIASLAVASPALAADRAVLKRAASALASSHAYVDPVLSGLARPDRLDYSGRIATRAADGRRVVIAFVSIPDARLDRFRERLYARLGFRSTEGTLVVASPTSITMRSSNLTPDAELAIIRRDGVALELPSRRYTDVLAELVYDTGLVVHNTTPGAIPRGDGRQRNLATFSGRFAGEHAGRSWLGPAVGLTAAALLTLVAAAGLRRARRG
jgi:hypothetical protein